MEKRIFLMVAEENITIQKMDMIFVSYYLEQIKNNLIYNKGYILNKSKKLILKKFPFSLNSSSCKSNILGLITLETDLTIEKELNFFLSKDDISL